MRNDFLIEKNRLVRYKGMDIKVIIPDEIEVIGKEAFIDNKTIEKVVLSTNVILIEEKAFSGCSKLRDVSFNMDLQSIEKEAFYKCSIDDIRLPKQVNIGERAFFGNQIIKLELRSHEGIIEKEAFQRNPIRLAYTKMNNKELLNSKIFGGQGESFQVIVKSDFTREGFNIGKLDYKLADVLVKTCMPRNNLEANSVSLFKEKANRAIMNYRKEPTNPTRINDFNKFKELTDSLKEVYIERNKEQGLEL